MEIQPAFLVLADISGYTRFIRLHKKALAHAEAVITNLLESVIDSSAYPLRLNKLEGDAALFFAPSPPSEESARDIIGQVFRFFGMFYRQQGKMMACDCCGCDACKAIGQLHLKAIVHYGDTAVKKVRRFVEIAGEDVILAHRLLKNSLERERYVLMTEPVVRMAGESLSFRLERRSERYEGFDPILVYVHYPEGAADPSAEAVTAWQGLGQYMAFQWHWLLRSIGMRRRTFCNIPSA